MATELLYDAAKRRNLDKDKNILDQSFQIQKSLMVSRLLEEEVKGQVSVTDSDVRMYFDAHKKEFMEKGSQKKLDDCRKDIEQVIRAGKEKEAQQRYISRLFEDQKAQLYRNVFR